MSDATNENDPQRPDNSEQPSPRPRPGGSLGTETLDIVYAMARNLLAQGQYEKARRCFVLLSIQAPEDPRFLSGVALCRQALGDHQEALRWYSRASWSASDTPVYILPMVESLIKLRAYESAKQLLRLLIDFCAATPGFDSERERALGILELIAGKNNDSVTSNR